MTKLEELYDAIQKFNKLGVQLSEQLIEQTNKVEEELIKNDVIPTLSDAIYPVISQIQRELVLVVEYSPNKPLSVRLTKKRSFAIPPEQDNSTETKEKKVEITPIIKEKYTISSHQKAGRTGLIVLFPNEELISERFASETFVKVIERIGYQKVEDLNITCNGLPIISKKKDDFYNQHELIPGVYVMTHSSTKYKRQLLEEISKKLNLGLEIEIIH